jgi:hypothetical protein
MSNTSNSQDLVKDWVNTMRPHWIRCQGNIHNDPKFWNECIHSRDDIWGSVIDFYCDVRGATWIDRKHPHLAGDLATIDQRQETGQRITIPYNKTGHNKVVFRATMAIKDVLCELTGEPMQDHLVWVKETVKKTKPTQAEVMAQWAKTQTMIESLFD